MKAKKWVSYGIFCLLIPAVVAGSALLFEEKQYAWVSLCAAVLACVPFFLHFERKTGSTQTLILVAAMVALSVVGRILFTPLPGFKPVTALVVITGMYFGGEAGFMTGALSAVISNFWFGQGPWTPFQMVSWGLIGFIAGLLASPLRRSSILLAVYGLFSGALFSLLMDTWTVLWQDGYFNLSRYWRYVLSSLPWMAVYALSNVIFLLLFTPLVGKVLERIKTKYGLQGRR